MPLPATTTRARGSGLVQLVCVTNLVRHDVGEHPPNLPIMVQAVHCIERPLPGHGSVVNLSVQEGKFIVTVQCKQRRERRYKTSTTDGNTVG